MQRSRTLGENPTRIIRGYRSPLTNQGVYLLRQTIHAKDQRADYQHLQYRAGPAQ